MAGFFISAVSALVFFHDMDQKKTCGTAPIIEWRSILIKLSRNRKTQVIFLALATKNLYLDTPRASRQCLRRKTFTEGQTL